MPIRIVSALALFILISLAAHAGVDVANGGFFDIVSDFSSGFASDGTSGDASGSVLSIERTFHSRSTYNGYFGFGWCSNLETLLLVGKNDLRLRACGGGRSVSYYPWKGKKGLWVSEENPADLIGWQKGRYVRNIPDGQKQFFDRKGLLMGWANKTSSVEVRRQRDVPFSLRESNGKYWRITWKSHRLTEIIGPDGRTLRYVYDGSRLAQVNVGKSTTQYTYSAGSNVVGIVRSNGEKIEVIYDEKRDWVKSVKSSDGCVEALAYEAPGRSQPFKATVRKKCPGSGAEERVFVINPSTGSVKGVSIVSQEDGPFKTEKHLDELGRVSRLTRWSGNLRQQEERIYDKLGRLSQWTVDGEVRKMAYQGLSVRIDRLLITDSKPTRGPASVMNLRYDYDKSGRPTSAHVNEILEMGWRYDEKGRLRTIIDSSGEEVTLSYESNAERVSGLKSTNLGEIKMHFAPSGELLKTESRPKTDATRIYMIYQKNLSLLAPLKLAPADT